MYALYLEWDRLEIVYLEWDRLEIVYWVNLRKLHVYLCVFLITGWVVLLIMDILECMVMKFSPLLKEPVSMTTISAPSSFPPLTSNRQLTASELQEVCPTAHLLKSFQLLKKNTIFY